MARLETVADKAGGAGEIQCRLRNVVARVGLDASGKLLALTRSGMWTDEHAVTAAFAHSFDHKLVEIGKNVLALFFFRHQEGLDVVEDRIFAEVVVDDVGYVGVESLVVSEAGAEGIRDGDVAGAIGIERAQCSQESNRRER